MTRENSEHLTPEFIAARIHKSVGTLANWRSQGTGPPYMKAGGTVLYPRDSYFAWETKQTKGVKKNGRRKR